VPLKETPASRGYRHRNPASISASASLNFESADYIIEVEWRETKEVTPMEIVPVTDGLVLFVYTVVFVGLAILAIVTLGNAYGDHS